MLTVDDMKIREKIRTYKTRADRARFESDRLWYAGQIRKLRARLENAR